jgi:hypothetical protein
MNYIFPESTIFLTGQARPSNEDAINAVYQTFSLCLIIDKDTDRIVDLACTTVMNETEDFVRTLLCGKNIISELDIMIENIKNRFFALIQKSLIVALKDAHNRYLMIFPDKRI